MKAGHSRLGATGLLLFLALLNVLNFTDRFLIQGFSVDMIADLLLSKLAFISLTGFAFSHLLWIANPVPKSLQQS